MLKLSRISSSAFLYHFTNQHICSLNHILRHTCRMETMGAYSRPLAVPEGLDEILKAAVQLEEKTYATAGTQVCSIIFCWAKLYFWSFKWVKKNLRVSNNIDCGIVQISRYIFSTSLSTWTIFFRLRKVPALNTLKRECLQPKEGLNPRVTRVRL